MRRRKSHVSNTDEEDEDKRIGPGKIRVMTMSQILRSVSDIKRSHVKPGSPVLDVDKYGDEYEDDDHDLGGPAPTPPAGGE